MWQRGGVGGEFECESLSREEQLAARWRSNHRQHHYRRV